MSQGDKERWEARHAGARVAGDPNPTIDLLPLARHSGAICLDIACGRGRHLPAIQSRGYAAVAVDIARSALTSVQNSAQGTIHCIEADLGEWPFAAESLDAAVQFDFFDRNMLPKLYASLLPGAPLLFETFLNAGHPNAAGPQRNDWLLQPGELKETFRDWQILELREQDGASARGTLLALRPS